MKKTVPLFIAALLLMITAGCGRTDNHDLTKWPEGSSPSEIGLRLAERYLSSPHSIYGDIASTELPTQITYPDVCTWLGSLWFTEATGNTDLFSRLETRFTPLFEAERHLLPLPNHVDNNVFGSVPLEFYLKTQRKEYLDLGLFYADTQ
jgi:hypothetical protein